MPARVHPNDLTRNALRSISYPLKAIILPVLNA